MRYDFLSPPPSSFLLSSSSSEQTIEQRVECIWTGNEFLALPSPQKNSQRIIKWKFIIHRLGLNAIAFPFIHLNGGEWKVTCPFHFISEVKLSNSLHRALYYCPLAVHPNSIKLIIHCYPLCVCLRFFLCTPHHICISIDNDFFLSGIVVKYNQIKCNFSRANFCCFY